MQTPNEWKIPCKRCGKMFGYSNRSYENSLQYGFSRPEYCDECQGKETRMRHGMGAPYFHVTHVVGEIKPGPLGFIERIENRVHTPVQSEGHFDEKRFGATPDKIYELAMWFRDPNHRVAVVVGPTGSGKSTAIPYWLVYPPTRVAEEFGENFFTKDGQILITLPRIAALKGIAKFVGIQLMGSTSVGKGFDVGYSYSEERNTDWRNVLIPQTDGQFINSLVSGKIGQYGIVVIDEAHERSENIETILRLLRDRMSLYPNLKVIIASATIDKEAFWDFFKDQGATIIELEGKRVDSNGQPVKYDRYFAEDDEQISYDDMKILVNAVPRAIKDKVNWLAHEIVGNRREWGDILIFLHSKGPIDKLVEQLRTWAQQDEELSDVVEVYPFYRDLEEEEKDKVLYGKVKPGKFKIILSTNYAEASLTIDTIAYVIDSGLEIQTQFRAETGATEYPVVLISKANAMQRWGRSGRTRNGEVFCLYTEDQFATHFIDYPIPAMQRSNMEGVVLAAKAAGIPNASSGWLGNPPEIEMERSTTVLMDSGALNEHGALTSYGLTLRAFSYTPRLLDLLMVADDVGCSVEMATVLPVIKNDGVRRLLNWRFNWDAYTKRDAYKRHMALMSGCVDDVDFILKLYKAWDELPWLEQRELNTLSDEEMNTLRKQWADLHFVNHKTMLAIQDERDKTLQRLTVSSKEESARTINLSLINRVRTLLTLMLTEKEVLVPSTPYKYNAETKPLDGTIAMCNLVPTDIQSGSKPETWLEIPVFEGEANGIFSRLFVDQVYPVGYRFAARVEEQGDGFAWITTTRNLTRAQALVQQTVSLTEEDEEIEEETDDDERMQVWETEVVPGISLSSFSTRYRSIECKQIVTTTSSLPTSDIVVEITGFYFQEGQVPTVVFEVVPQPEPFEVFVKRHRYSDEVTVQVIDVLQYPGDFTATLVVKDVETQLEVLLEPQDLSFTRSSFAVTQISVDTRLTFNVENIDIDLKRIRLTNWEKVEQAITDRFGTTEGDDETTVAKAMVIEIRDDGKVVFALDIEQKNDDVAVITSAYGTKLPKLPGEFSVNENAVLKVYRRSRATAHSNLSSLPKKAVSKVGPEERKGELSWKRGVLRFTGRMSYDRLYELKTMADRDIDFIRALEQLYWYSNSIYVAQFIDSEFYTHMETKLAVGTTIDNALVIEVNDGGVVVELGRGLTGFIPRSKIMDGKGNLISLLTSGMVVQVKVLEHRIDQGEPLLSITGGVSDPIAEIAVGQTYNGVVEDVNKAGIFVSLATTVTGRVKHNEVYRGRHNTEDLFQAGDAVVVKAISVNQHAREVELTMKIPENDPIGKIYEGQLISGTIMSVKDFGAFIEILPGLEGMMHRSAIAFSGQTVSDLTSYLRPGMEMTVKILSITYNQVKGKYDISLQFHSMP